MDIEQEDYSFVADGSSHFKTAEPGDEVSIYEAGKILENGGFQIESVHTVGSFRRPWLFIHENEVVLLGSRHFDGETLFLEMKRLFMAADRKAVVRAVEKVREDCLPVEIFEYEDGSWAFRGEMDDDVDMNNFLARLETDVAILRKAISRVEESDGVDVEPWPIMLDQRQLFIHEVIEASLKMKALKI